MPYLASLLIDSLTEIGCGNGRFALKAAMHFKQVTVVDWAISPVISEAIKRENLKYLVADVLLAPISQSDTIASADFFEYLEEKDVILLTEKIAIPI